MAKMILVSLFSSIFLWGDLNATDLKTSNVQPERIGGCNAAPPDSLRITSLSSNSVSLAWDPIWEDATHRLIIFKRSETQEWSPLDTIENAPGSTITLDGLDLDIEHKVSISTNCSINDPSDLQTSIDHINLIIDLTLAGLTPINPVPVSCDNIPLNYPWIGFRITYNYLGFQLSNLFEIREALDEDNNNGAPTHFEIRRVGINNPIVAVNEDGNYPTHLNDNIPDVGTPFRVDRLLGSGSDREEIGELNLVTGSSKIRVCPVLTNPLQPWLNGYTFTALIAQNVSGQVAPSIGEERIYQNSNYNDGPKALSPFEGILNIFLPEAYLKSSKITLQLFDLRGKQVGDRLTVIHSTQVTLPCETLQPGVYLLVIKTDEVTKTLKVIKA
jgi:hypothetical protein